MGILNPSLHPGISRHWAHVAITMLNKAYVPLKRKAIVSVFICTRCFQLRTWQMSLQEQNSLLKIHSALKWQSTRSSSTPRGSQLCEQFAGVWIIPELGTAWNTSRDKRSLLSHPVLTPLCLSSCASSWFLPTTGIPLGTFKLPYRFSDARGSFTSGKTVCKGPKDPEGPVLMLNAEVTQQTSELNQRLLRSFKLVKTLAKNFLADNWACEHVYSTMKV